MYENSHMNGQLYTASHKYLFPKMSEYSLEMYKQDKAFKHLSFYTIFRICKEFRGNFFVILKSQYSLKLCGLANISLIVKYVEFPTFYWKLLQFDMQWLE